MVDLIICEIYCHFFKTASRGVRGVVQCGFGQFLTPHFVVWFRQNHNCTVPHFCGHMCGAVWCGAVQRVQSLAKTITAPHLIFAVTYAVRYIKCGLKPIYFSNFGLFLPSTKLIFPFILGFGPSFKLLSQFFFILGWFS